MRASRVLTFLALMMVLALGTISALDDPAGASGEPSPEAAAAPAAVAPILSPEMQEITAVLEAERLQVRELTAVLKKEADDKARLVMVRRIEQTKIGAEISVLKIQARYALAAGLDEQARQLDESVTQLQAALDAAATPSPAPAGR